VLLSGDGGSAGLPGRVRALRAAVRAGSDAALRGFGPWRRRRPFLGGVLTILAGIEMLFSGPIDLEHIQLQVGFAGSQATVLPTVLIVLGALAIAHPVQHLFYGIVSLVVAVSSLVFVNLGGFVVGMLLGVVGGVIVVSWMGAADGAVTTQPKPLGSPGKSAAVVLVAALVAPAAAPTVDSGAAGGQVLCWMFGVTCTEPGATPGPSPSASPSPSDLVGGVVDGIGEGPVVDPGAAPGTEDNSSTGGVADPDVTVPVPGDGAPDEEELPVFLGGSENVSVFSVPAELRSDDLTLSGLRSISIVSVPAATPSGRRNALKIVCDRAELPGFWLKTYVYEEGLIGGGTETHAQQVTLDGNVQMYVSSISADLPGEDDLQVDAENPPQTITAALLALVDPTIGLLGATSDQQVWTGFREQVWGDPASPPR
jgi:hypothetical protein